MNDSTARRHHAAPAHVRRPHHAPTARALRRAVRRANAERGDVPGWVMVTLMTAGLVIAIWAVAGNALTTVFQTAIDRVMGI